MDTRIGKIEALRDRLRQMWMPSLQDRCLRALSEAVSQRRLTLEAVRARLPDALYLPLLEHLHEDDAQRARLVPWIVEYSHHVPVELAMLEHPLGRCSTCHGLSWAYLWPRSVAGALAPGRIAGAVDRAGWQRYAAMMVWRAAGQCVGCWAAARLVRLLEHVPPGVRETQWLDSHLYATTPGCIAECHRAAQERQARHGGVSAAPLERWRDALPVEAYTLVHRGVEAVLSACGRFDHASRWCARPRCQAVSDRASCLAPRHLGALRGYDADPHWYGPVLVRERDDLAQPWLHSLCLACAVDLWQHGDASVFA